MLQKYIKAYRLRNYEICTAINTTNLSCVLADMVMDGSISLVEAEAYTKQAKGLQQIISIANKRGFESKTN